MASAAPLRSPPGLLRGRRLLPAHFRAAPSLSPRGAPSLPPRLFSAAAKASIDSAASKEAFTSASASIRSAADVVRCFYEGVNRRDLDFVAELIADNCVYEDLVFSSPFVGRKAIINFLKKFSESISSDLQFVIDDISKEDSQHVGVTWHLEWKGRPFPFSKGCSFYQLNVLDGRRQIVYGRDIVEPAIKPGDAALVIIKGVTSLLQHFPQLAERL